MKKERENIILISTEVPKEMLERLDKWAKENYTTRSSAMRLAIKNLLESKEINN